MTVRENSAPPDVMALRAVTAPVLAWREAGRNVLVASDLDGTLAPIVDRPEHARVDTAALIALRTLRRAGITTCVVSGRTLGDLERLLGADHGCVLVAEHGAITAFPDGRVMRESLSTEQLDALAAIARRAQPVVDRYDGAEIERKSTSVAIHVRRVADAQSDDVQGELRALATLAQSQGLRTIAGRAVLEVRPPMANKGDGLRRVRATTAPDAAVLFAGDDATDEPALTYAADHGIAVYIRSDERPQPPEVRDLVVASQSQWVAALAYLADTLQPDRAP